MVKGCLLYCVARDRLPLHKLVHEVAEMVPLDNLLSLDADSDLRALDRIEVNAVFISHSELSHDEHGHIDNEDVFHEFVYRNFNA